MGQRAQSHQRIALFKCSSHAEHQRDANTNGVKSLDSFNATEQDLLAVALGAPARQVLLRAEEVGYVFRECSHHSLDLGTCFKALGARVNKALGLLEHELTS